MNIDICKSPLGRLCSHLPACACPVHFQRACKYQGIPGTVHILAHSLLGAVQGEARGPGKRRAESLAQPLPVLCWDVVNYYYYSAMAESPDQVAPQGIRATYFSSTEIPYHLLAALSPPGKQAL